MSGGGQRVRRALAAGLSLVLATVLGLALGESAVRLVLPQQLVSRRADIYRPEEGTGWRRRGSVDTEINTGERSVRVRTDAEGFRVDTSGARTGSRELLLIGDSFMEALQVDYASSVAGLLDARLARSPASGWVVRNAGVGGWDPPQYRVEAERLLARPGAGAALVVLYAGNDASLVRPVARVPALPIDESPRFRVIPDALTWSGVVQAWLAPLNDVLETRSHLFALVKNRTQVLRMRLGLSAVYFPDEYRVRERQSPRWGVAADAVADIVSAARARGLPAVVAIIPAPFQFEPDRFQAEAAAAGLRPEDVDREQSTRELGHALACRGIAVVDLTPALGAAVARGVPMYGRVDRHFTPEGHRVATEALWPAIEGALAGQPSPTTPPDPSCPTR